MELDLQLNVEVQQTRKYQRIKRERNDVSPHKDILALLSLNDIYHDHLIAQICSVNLTHILSR